MLSIPKLINLYKDILLFSKTLNSSRMSPPTLFKSVDKILEFLNQNKDNDLTVNKLLAIYREVASNKPSNEQRKFPLVVFEGLDGCGKSTITKKVANKVNGVLFCTPPPILHSIRSLFDDNEELRTAYYQLGNYIAGIQIAKLLETQPVILDRFWHSTAAYAIADAVRKNPTSYELPSTGNDVYLWPFDLLKPDMVILLSVREVTRLSRISRRINLTTQEQQLKDDEKFRNNVLSAFDKMVKPSIQKVDANGYPNKIVPEIVSKINHLSSQMKS